MSRRARNTGQRARRAATPSRRTRSPEGRARPTSTSAGPEPIDAEDVERLQRLAGNRAVADSLAGPAPTTDRSRAQDETVVVQRYSTRSDWRQGLPPLPKTGPSVEAELRKHYPGLLRAVTSSQLAQWQSCFDYGARAAAVDERRAKLQSFYRRNYGSVWTQHPHYLQELDRLERQAPDKPDVTSITIKVSALFSDGLDIEPDWDVQANMDFRAWAKEQIGSDEITIDLSYGAHAKGFARDPLWEAPTHTKGIIGVAELQKHFRDDYLERVPHRKMVKDLKEALDKIEWLRSEMAAEHRFRVQKNREQPLVKFIAESLGYWSTGDLASEPSTAIWNQPKKYVERSQAAYDARQIELLVPLLVQAQERTRGATAVFVQYETHVMKGAGSAIAILSAAKWAGTLAAGALTGGTSLVGSALAAGGYTLVQEGAQQGSEVYHGQRESISPGELAKQAGTAAVLALVGGSLQKKFTDALRIRVPAGVTNPKVRELLASGTAAGLSSTYTTAVQVGLDQVLASPNAPKSAAELGDLIVKNAVTSVLLDAGMRGTNAQIAQEFAALRAGLPRGKLLPEPTPGVKRPAEDGTLRVDAIRRLLVKGGGWTRLRQELESGTGLAHGLSPSERRSAIEQFESHRAYFAIESAELFGGRVIRDAADPSKPIEVHFDGPDGPARSIQAKEYLDKARPGWSRAGVRLVIGTSTPLSKQEMAKQHLHYALGHEVGPMAARFEKIYFQWDSLTPQQRLDAVARIANEPLVAAGYPPLAPKMITSSTAHGQMNPQDWSLDVNRSLLKGSAVEVERFAQLADTAAHEGRHGLQWVRAARLDPSGQAVNQFHPDIRRVLLSGSYKGKSLETLAAGSEAHGDAKRFYDAVFGGRAGHREGVYDQMSDAKTQLESIKTQILDGRKSGSLTRSQEIALIQQFHAENRRLMQAHRDYKALPEEADAWRYGGEVGVSIRASLRKRFEQFARQGDRHSSKMSKEMTKQQMILAGLGGTRVTSGLTGAQLAKFERALDRYFKELDRLEKVHARSRALWDEILASEAAAAR